MRPQQGPPHLWPIGHRSPKVLLARGRRLADLQASGLILEEAESGQRTVVPVTVVAALDPDEQYDLVLVPVRSEQLAAGLAADPDTLRLMV